MTLVQPQAFFTALRAGLLAPTLTDGEVSGCNAILAACAAWPLSWAAYGLATAYHETAHTLQPVREAGSEAYLARMYDASGLRPQVAARLGNTQPGDGVRYAGKGFVQLTGRANYAHAAAELGVPFVDDPDLALEPVHAAAIMARGMAEGWFTGKSLATYLPAAGPATKAQFMMARRIINGSDKQDPIADYAARFQDALLLGSWS